MPKATVTLYPGPAGDLMPHVEVRGVKGGSEYIREGIAHTIYANLQPVWLDNGVETMLLAEPVPGVYVRIRRAA